MTTQARKLATRPEKPVLSKAGQKELKDYARKDLLLPRPADGDVAGSVARTLTRPEVGAAAVIEQWQKDTHDVNALAAELSRQVDAVNTGDMRRPEGMLIAQAHALQEIFVNLARRATSQEYLTQWEAYMRMAMKAQSQCRMTLETLAAIKNPPVVFAKQANINNGGQQQVNNGAQPEAFRAHAPFSHACAPAGNLNPEKTELLEASDGKWLDSGTAGAAGDADPHLATLGTIDRSANRRGKGEDGTQR